MTDFRKLYAAWRAKPFPPGSSSEALDEVHADLAVADSWVAEIVIPFVEHGSYRPAQVDVSGTLKNIRQRALEIAQSEGEGRQLAREYEQYAQLLEQVYDAFLGKTRV